MATSVLGLKTFAASDPVDVNEVNDNYVKIDNGVKTAMQGRAAHNWLDNSDFRNPVNQRGATSYSAAGYHIDRWKKENASGTVTVGNNYIAMTGTGAYWFLTQFVPTNKIKSGAVYTVALADTSGSVGVCSTVMSTDMTKFTARHTFTSGAVVAINVEYTSDKYAVYFTSNSSAETRFAWAALYEGAYDASTLPAYQPKGYAAELAECMRYYYRSNDSNSGQDGMIIRRAINAGNNANAYSLESVDLPVPMRITPTITVFDSFGNKNYVQEWYSNDQVRNTSIRYANNRSFCVANESRNFIGGKSYYFNYEACADL